jgi:hypothetical protein
MAPRRRTFNLIAAAATAVLACSCGLRLPVEIPPVQKIEVRATSESPVPAPVADPARPPDVLVWLTADNYHTGMVFPFDWLVESGFVPPDGFPSPKYVALSWGNRDAYSKEGFDHPWKVFRVLFTPTDSVMELIPIDWDVAEVIPGQRVWRKLVPRERGPAVAAFLNQCSTKDPEGFPRVVCESSWGDGVQLESPHAYFIPRICNVWTAQAIEALGGEVQPWFGLTASGLIRQAESPPNDFELIWPGGGPIEGPR